MNPILKKLAGADRRSTGRSDEVVAEVLATPLTLDFCVSKCKIALSRRRVLNCDAAVSDRMRHHDIVAL